MSNENKFPFKKKMKTFLPTPQCTPRAMPRFPKKAKGSAPPASAPVGPDAILEAVEDALERGEKKLRDREPAKAQKLFREALSQVQAANLSNHPHGSVLLSSLTGSLLTIDSDDARLASWARRSKEKPASEPLLPGQRFGALQAAATAMEAGQVAAEAAGALPEELSLMCDSRAQLATLLSEECEAQAVRAGGSAAGGGSPVSGTVAAASGAAAAAAAAAAALEWSAHAVTWWEAAGRLLLESQAGEEWEPEPDVELLCRLGSACMRHGKLLLAQVGLPAEEAAAAAASGEAMVERALALYSEACACCDSAKGDAIDEVLRDWAQALWDASALASSPEPASAATASAAFARAVGAAGAAVQAAARRQAARELLELAASKATDSVAMLVVPLVSSCNLLGDVLNSSADVERDEAAAGGAAAIGEALRLHERSIREGYERALHVNSRDLRAQIGAADGWLSIARLQLKLSRSDSAPVAATAAWRESLGRARALYATLLGVPVAQWVAQGLAAHECAEARYNCCCALALQCGGGGGGAAAKAECRAMLSSVLAQGDARAHEVMADEDFAHLAGCDWWAPLVDAAAEAAAAETEAGKLLEGEVDDWEARS